MVGVDVVFATLDDVQCWMNGSKHVWTGHEMEKLLSARERSGVAASFCICLT